MQTHYIISRHVPTLTLNCVHVYTVKAQPYCLFQICAFQNPHTSSHTLVFLYPRTITDTPDPSFLLHLQQDCSDLFHFLSKCCFRKVILELTVCLCPWLKYWHVKHHIDDFKGRHRVFHIKWLIYADDSPALQTTDAGDVFEACKC